MAIVDVSMTGSGTVGDNSDWSVNESATPISIASNEGSTGSVNLAAKSTDLSKFIINNEVVFTHSTLGVVEGSITDVNVSGVSVDYTVSPVLSLLTTDRVAPPTGQQTLSSIFTSYVALVTDTISVSYIATTNPTRIYGGWSGDVWTHIKALCAANAVEVAFSGTTLIVRDVGSTIFNVDDSQQIEISLDTSSTGRNVEVVYHNYELITIGSLVYNYSQNPSLESNATNWSATKNSYGTITSGRVT